MLTFIVGDQGMLRDQENEGQKMTSQKLPEKTSLYIRAFKHINFSECRLCSW